MPGTRPRIALIGTLDTKGPEIQFVRDRIEALGADALIIDSGILGVPAIEPEFSREQVAEAAGRTLDEIQRAGSRGAAVELMQAGLRTLVRRLYDDGRVDGVLCLGGAEGALMGSTAMQGLPIGVPKLLVSPVASGRREFGPLVGSSDILIMHSVVDILGLNAIARSVFGNAAAAIVGMCRWGAEAPASELPCVGITMLGQTTPGAMVVAEILEAAGYEPIIFHANGVGGPAMDQLVRDGRLAGVVDYTLSEPANSLMGGLHATSPERMRAAVEAGLPLVVVPGAADFFNQGPLDTVPREYLDRAHYKHNPVATLVRLNESEMRELGSIIAKRLEGATRSTAVMVPTRGLSLIGVDDGAIADSAADAALTDELRTALPSMVQFETFGLDVNDRDFAAAVASKFLELAQP